MAKRLHEITNFNKGTYITPSDTDIPEEAADYSLNIDPMAKDGVLKGMPKDLVKYFRDSGDTVNSTTNAGASGTVISLLATSSFAASGSVIFVDNKGYVQILAYGAKDDSSKRLTSVTGWNSALGTLGNGQKVYQYTSATNFNSDSSKIIVNGDATHLVYHDSSDNKIKKIDNFKQTSTEPPYLDTVDNTAQTVSGRPTMVNNNKEVHIGTGNTLTTKPLWVGFEGRGQFGTSASTNLKLADAELHSPTTFPSFHKTVEYGNYLYGITFDSKYLYYIDKSGSDYPIYVSNLLFTKTKAMALDHNNYLMIIDDNNTIVWVDVSSTTHSVVKTYGITKAGTYTGEMTDIIETGASSTYYVWIAQAASATTHASTGTPPQTTTGLGLLQSASYPSGSEGTLSFTDRTPWQGYKSSLGTLGTPIVGHWAHSNASNSTDFQVSIWTYPHSLVKGSDSNWVGWICEFTHSSSPTTVIQLLCATNSQTEGGVYEFTNMNGAVLNYVKNDYTTTYSTTEADDSNPNPTKWFPVRLKHETASLDIIGRYGASGDTNSAAAQSTFNGITSIYSHDGGHATDDRIFITLNEEGTSGVTSTNTKILSLTYNDPTPSGTGNLVSNHWFDHAGSGSGQHNTTPTVFYFGQDPADSSHPEGRLATNVYSTDASKVKDMRLTSNDSGFTYGLFLTSGSGNGKLATLNATNSTTFASWTNKQVAPLDLTLSQTDMVTNGSFSASKEYWYKASFLYDGYQESPLSIATQLSSPTNKDVEITIDLYTDTLSSRVTHVNLYRAESGTDGDTEPTGFYRLVDTYDLDVSWKLSTDATWGSTRTKTVIDNYKLGASYEARTGISEVLDHTIPNYSLSADLNSHLFVAKCHHQLVHDADNYIFKSKAYMYDQFNWINDFLILPTTPTALKAFNGRLYAFDEFNMHKIEPNNLYIEDSIEGIGCLSQRSISITDYGMCFCDKNNIYLYNGQSAVPISMPIYGTSSDDHSWNIMDDSYDPIIVFSNKYKSFIVLFKSNDGTYKIWSYNVIKQRWDLWEAFQIQGGSLLTNEPTHMFLDSQGNINVSINNLIYMLYADPVNKRNWDWTSKQITLGQNTQNKRFNNFYVTGTPNGSLDANPGISIKVDGSGATEDGSLSSFVLTSNQSGKKLQWIIQGQTGEVDALGTVYRRKIVTSEQ